MQTSNINMRGSNDDMINQNKSETSHISDMVIDYHYGATPNGGVRAEAHYLNSNHEYVPKDKADVVLLKEFDGEGNLIMETMLVNHLKSVLHCQKCGLDFISGESFCNKCGQKLELMNVKEKNKNSKIQIWKKDNNKTKSKVSIFKMVSVCVVLLVVITMGTTFALKLIKPKDEQAFVKKDEDVMVLNNENGYYVLDRDFDIKQIGEDMTVESTSINGKTIVSEEAWIEEYPQGSLRVFFDGKEAVIDKEVMYYKISYDGKFIVYSVETNRDNNHGDLYLYDVIKDESSKITSDVLVSEFAVSPNGLTVSYIDYVDGSDNFNRYISFNGEKGKKVGKNEIPMAISDDAEYEYYVEYDEEKGEYGDFIVKTEDDKNVLLKQSELDDFEYCFFSYDKAEAIFMIGEKYYYTKGIIDREKILSSSEVIEILMPEDTVYFDHRDTGMDSDGFITVGAKRLTEKFYLEQDAIFYFNEELEMIKVMNEWPKTYKISEDGKSMLFIDQDENLCLYSGEKDKETTVVKSENINEFVASKDFERIYFTNDDDELFYQVKNKKAKKIFDEETYNFVLVGDETLYFVNDSELYSTKNGEEPDKVKGSEEAHYLFQKNGFLIYAGFSPSDRGHELYTLDDRSDSIILEDSDDFLLRMSYWDYEYEHIFEHENDEE